VDDDQTILQLFTAALVRDGFEVLTAASGNEALRKVAENTLQVVLLDINLPDLNGIEVMRRIVKTTSIVVILITGDDAHYSYETAVQEGASDFILKPVRLSELALRIKQSLEVRRLAEAKERLVADLERLAVKDELTELFNYRHFQAQLRAEVQRCQRYERPLSLIVFDADHFKGINDTLGHAEGDRVLAGIARVLRTSVRATDTAFRYGGEEFAVLLPETHGSQALGVAERARQEVESAGLLKERPVTVSAGVAELRPSDQGDDLLRRADSSLYAAKRGGRNRVSLA
jgi:diguanylate cyclase (GGDEF)-like protein